MTGLVTLGTDPRGCGNSEVDWKAGGWEWQIWALHSALLKFETSRCAPAATEWSLDLV